MQYIMLCYITIWYVDKERTGEDDAIAGRGSADSHLGSPLLSVKLARLSIQEGEGSQLSYNTRGSEPLERALDVVGQAEHEGRVSVGQLRWRRKKKGGGMRYEGGRGVALEEEQRE